MAAAVISPGGLSPEQLAEQLILGGRNRVSDHDYIAVLGDLLMGGELYAGYSCHIGPVGGGAQRR